MSEPDHQITPADVAANTKPKPPRQRQRTRAGKSNTPSLAAVAEPVPRPGPELMRDLKAIGATNAEHAFYSSHTGIDWDVLGLLAGMMILVNVVQRSHFSGSIVTSTPSLSRRWW